MATTNRKARRAQEPDTFYEAMPMAGQGYYGDYAEPNPLDLAPDHDFDRIDDTGRDIAIRTLVFVALATIVLCLLLIWGVQIAQETLPAVSPMAPQ